MVVKSKWFILAFILSVANVTSSLLCEAPTINSVTIEGNSQVSTEAIRSKVPFIVGQPFERRLSASMLKNLHTFGVFSNIQLFSKPADDEPDEVDLIVRVTEKKRLSGIVFEGNQSLATDKLRKKLEVEKIKTLDAAELPAIADRIKKVYRDERMRHHLNVTGELLPDEGKDTVKARFVIDEGISTYVRRIRFEGNKHIPDNILRSRLFTRESWPLGFLDMAGAYHPDALLQDKYTLENFVQSCGYFTGRVVDAKVEEFPSGAVDITFIIEEGDLYTIKSIAAPGNELLSEQQILANLPLCEGQYYSKDAIRAAIDRLRTIWGEYGYIYADVQPGIKPDAKNKTVEIVFNSDLGSKIRVNRIDIVGNYKTLDKVIRRELLFDEGDTLTKRMMDESKRRVQLLGYFDQRDGVNWKLIKTDDENVDLELVVKEKSTGELGGKLSWGGQANLYSPTSGAAFEAFVKDTNFRGTGTQYNLSGRYSFTDSALEATAGNAWLFDRPISGSVSAFTRDIVYEEFNQTVAFPNERSLGGSVRSGFRVGGWEYADFDAALGDELIYYKTANLVRRDRFVDPLIADAVQCQINRTFIPGDLLWASLIVGGDRRDHPMYPTTGYRWGLDLKCGIPHSGSPFGYMRSALDVNWYTTLIDEYRLVLHLHGFLGYVFTIRNGEIPYRELFHIGGPATVRGFLFGQIGPSILGSSLGAMRALVVNAELIFPLSADGNIHGFVFYDGGAGWHTPNASCIERTLLSNNTFNYRHAVGIGINVERPTPVRVEWGVKLDRKRRFGETPAELHISMSRPF